VPKRALVGSAAAYLVGSGRTTVELEVGGMGEVGEAARRARRGQRLAPRRPPLANSSRAASMVKGAGQRRSQRAKPAAGVVEEAAAGKISSRRRGRGRDRRGRSRRGSPTSTQDAVGGGLRWRADSDGFDMGVIYIGAIKKDLSYLHAIKKFGDTSMP
jgi:hypothetical protein